MISCQNLMVNMVINIVYNNNKYLKTLIHKNIMHTRNYNTNIH